MDRNLLQDKINSTFIKMEELVGYNITLIIPKRGEPNKKTVVKNVPCLISNAIYQSENDDSIFSNNIKTIDIRIDKIIEINNTYPSPVIPLPPQGSLKTVGTQIKIFGHIYNIVKEDGYTGFGKIIRLYCEKKQ